MRRYETGSALATQNSSYLLIGYFEKMERLCSEIGKGRNTTRYSVSIVTQTYVF